jgi:hypothetical protein
MKLWIFALILGGCFSPALADEVGPDLVQPIPAPTVLPTKKSRRGFNEKETEGTQALDRFEANTVLKSQYELDGKSLEVDPD